MNNITLESVADHFYISKEYLSKMFKIHTKMNFSYYITEKRMKKAKELIVEQGIKIKNVAELVGYVDITHFYKKFKKYYGITPGEMREKIKLQ
ncbi:MAG: helix-turn-helix transcriptional regulator, partial [Clostridiaceae bacterium]